MNHIREDNHFIKVNQESARKPLIINESIFFRQPPEASEP